MTLEPAAPSAAGSDAMAMDGTIRSMEVECTSRQQQQLLAYVEVLSKWNAVHNLTAIRAREEILTHHVADCLSTVAPIARLLQTHVPAERRPRLLDVGSGGGLPGLIIATMLPGVDVTCVDSVGKKAAFIQQAALSMSLPNVSAVHDRVEALRVADFDLIVSRAFATLDRFVTSTRQLLQPSGYWMAMKGKVPSDEIAALAGLPVNVFHVEQLAIPGLDAARCLVWIEPR